MSELVASVPEEWQQEGVPTFVVSVPSVSRSDVVIQGWLVNDTDSPVVTYLLSAPHTLGPMDAMLSGPSVKLRPYTGPQMPEIYPAPERLTMPPHTRIPYERAVVLSRYEYTPGAKVTLSWEFAFWRKRAFGTVDILLP